MNITSLLRTLLTRLLVIIIVLLCIIPGIIIAFIPQNIRLRLPFVYTFIHGVYRLLLAATFVPIYYKNIHLINQESAIFVSNHQSSLDILLVGVLMKSRPHIWFARSELMRFFIVRFIIPVFALVVDVNSCVKAAACLMRLLKISKQTNASVILFPEGARYSDGLTHDFFGGFALMAKKLNKPVIPIKIKGAHIVYPIKSFIIRRSPITVTVGPAVWIQAHESCEEFKKRIHRWYMKENKENRVCT